MVILRTQEFISNHINQPEESSPHYTKRKITKQINKTKPRNIREIRMYGDSIPFSAAVGIEIPCNAP